jgi:hypothetical protein
MSQIKGINHETMKQFTQFVLYDDNWTKQSHINDRGSKMHNCLSKAYILIDESRIIGFNLTISDAPLLNQL